MAQAAEAIPVVEIEPDSISEQVRDIINESIPDHEFSVAAVAETILIRLKKEGLYEQWVESMALRWLKGWLSSKHLYDMRRRAHSNARGGDARHGKFAIEERLFNETYYTVSDDNIKKRLGEMNGKDHIYVAEQYQESANSAALLAEFHRAVAKKVRTKTTAEVFDPDTYLRLMESIMGGKEKK